MEYVRLLYGKICATQYGRGRVTIMKAGYIRISDGHTTDLNLEPILNKNGTQFKLISSNNELILDDGEKIIWKDVLDSSIYIGNFRHGGSWQIIGPTLIILTEKRIILLRQPGGALPRDATYTHYNTRNTVNKAISVSGRGYKEFVSLYLDEIHKWDAGGMAVDISGQYNHSMDWQIFFKPRDKAEILFYDFIPRKKMRKKNIEYVQEWRNKVKNNDTDNFETRTIEFNTQFVPDSINQDSRIIESSIPLSGYDKPTYCGRCGQKTKVLMCQKCNISKDEFIQKSNDVPLIIKAGIYLSLFIMVPGLFFLGILYSSMETTREAGFFFYLTTPFILYYSYKAYTNIARVSDLGYINCANCHKRVSPVSKKCVYCGQRISWIT